MPKLKWSASAFNSSGRQFQHQPAWDAVGRDGEAVRPLAKVMTIRQSAKAAYGNELCARDDERWYLVARGA